jgi:hypothetical protein
MYRSIQPISIVAAAVTDGERSLDGGRAVSRLHFTAWNCRAAERGMRLRP